MKLLKKLEKYWDIKKPVFLQHQPEYDGRTITTYFAEKKEVNGSI